MVSRPSHQPRVVAIVQARMSSRRLPGKVMLPLAGKPVLWHVVSRARLIRGVHEIVVATSEDSSDDLISAWCENNSVPCFRGSLDDVLERYVACAEQYEADVVVRITGDCPLIDPETSSLVVHEFLSSSADFASLAGSFPDGLDTQLFSLDSLRIASQATHIKSDREHVGPYIERNPARFNIVEVNRFSGLGHLRLTLDEMEDYLLLIELFDKHGAESMSFSQVKHVLDRFPELQRINRAIPRNEGFAVSLENDRHQ